jgi:chorismate dehydratase
MSDVENGVPKRVASVPYVNAMPLVDGLSHDISVAFDLPSRLPAVLESGDADAVLVSSVYALSLPGARVADGVGIVSDGAVESVRVFSRGPLGEVRRLALDPASMTSNLLARLVLKEVYGVCPEAEPVSGGLEAMLDGSDAAVLIGDAGMTAAIGSVTALDLGEVWTSWTGLPFVWALWTGLEGLDTALAMSLSTSPKRVGAGRGSTLTDSYVDSVVERSGWSRETVRRYLGQTMVYGLGEREKLGLSEFARRLGEAGLAGGLGLPVWVGSGPDGTGTLPDPGTARVPVGM